MNQPEVKTEITKTVREINAWIITWLADELNIEATDIDVKEPFVNLGLNSRQAVLLTGELEDWLGLTLDPSLAWEYPTIEKLAQYLINPSES